MGNICETAVNLCFLCYTELTSGSVTEMLSSCRKQLCDLSLPAPERVYLGAEFCDRVMLFMEKERLLDAVKFLNRQNYRVTYVIPPLRQSNFRRNLELADFLLEHAGDGIDEVTANDFGTLSFLHQEGTAKNRGLSAGRLFDKGIREGRFDLFRNRDFKRNEEEASRLGLTEPPYPELFRSLGVTRLETDTLPDGVLSAGPGCPLGISIHYPRIYLSRASYCEFSGIGRTGPGKFRLEEMCRMQCSNQFQRIPLEEGRTLFKIGNAVFTRQNRPAEETVGFRCRLVYSLL